MTNFEIISSNIRRLHKEQQALWVILMETEGVGLDWDNNKLAYDKKRAEWEDATKNALDEVGTHEK